MPCIDVQATGDLRDRQRHLGTDLQVEGLLRGFPIDPRLGACRPSNNVMPPQQSRQLVRVVPCRLEQEVGQRYAEHRCKPQHHFQAGLAIATHQAAHRALDDTHSSRQLRG